MQTTVMYTLPRGMEPLIAKEETTMKSLNEKKNTYRLSEKSTQEMLECDWKTVIRFGNKILLAGYYYSGPKAKDYFAAVYEFTTGDTTCEGEIKLTAISDEHFEDAGHALQWGMNH